MSNQPALDPASSIISAFGGIEQVVAITKAHRTRVYRWTQPKARGGTDGIIPFAHAARLLQHAKENDIAVSAEDFIPEPAPTKEPTGGEVAA